MNSPIHCSAIQVGKTLYTGKRHHDCFKHMAQLGVSKLGAVQGFVDTEGIFYDRYHALEVAKKFNQILVKHNPQDRLLSEDVWVD